MSIREVEVLNYVPDKGFLVKYIAGVSSGIIRRRTSYFNEDVLNKDDDNELIEKIKDSINHYKIYNRDK